MYIIIWEYQVKPENRSKFEEAYSSNGVWAALFKKGTGYLGAELLHSEQSPDTYITIDRWDSKDSYETFLERWNIEYNELDRLCGALTVDEKHINSFLQVT